MALVAYDDSDISDDEYDDKTENNIVIENNKIPIKNVREEKTADDILIENKLKLPPPRSCGNIENESFLKLPQPKEIPNVSLIEEDDEFLKKKEVPEIKPPPSITRGKRVKIQLPALSDLQDEESPTANVQLKSPEDCKSGLLGILPPPKEFIVSNKSKRTMIPHVLSKKLATNINAKQNHVTKKSITQKEKMESLIHYDTSDESDSEPIESANSQNSDFFSLNKEYKLPEVSYVDLNSLKVKNTNYNDTSKLNAVKNCEFVDSPISFVNTVSLSVIEEQQNKDEEIKLDEEALRQLCGSRAKRFKPENIQIIDMSHKDVLPNEEEWMREALQEATAGPRTSHGVKPLGGPSSTQKRKHQITYLAQQAKANEIELQNQWANNRMTRRQTQSKYGF